MCATHLQHFALRVGECFDEVAHIGVYLVDYKVILEVLKMRYYNDMSFKEISDATGVSINTALGRMRYAILNMRRIAEEKSIELTA